MRRISDALISGWNYVWAVNMLAFKLLDLASPFKYNNNGFSSFALLTLSAASSLFILVMALLVDTLLVSFRVRPTTPSMAASKVICKGGICWHSVRTYRLCNDRFGFL